MTCTGLEDWTKDVKNLVVFNTPENVIENLNDISATSREFSRAAVMFQRCAMELHILIWPRRSYADIENNDTKLQEEIGGPRERFYAMMDTAIEGSELFSIA
jgi:hypothetical protein